MSETERPEAPHSEFEGSGAGALVAGRYRLGEAIGHGGMATVFRASDEKLGRTVAVKVFTTGDPNPDDTARRVREMRLLAAANHPHLVTLFDAEWPTAEAPRPGFLVMELVEGESLRRRIDRLGPDPELARRVAIELSGALAYLHEQGIVHRDLKPENILIDSATGATKLVDFGIAQFVGAERITTDGTVLGTAAYLSPEQVRGAPVAPAADVYALGLVVLECVTGRRVFPGPAVEAAIARVTNDPAMPSGLPAEWVELLTAMTARKPEARPAAAALPTAVAALEVPTLPQADGDTMSMTAPTPTHVFTGGYSAAAPGDTAPTVSFAAQGDASVPAAAAAASAETARWSSSAASPSAEAARWSSSAGTARIETRASTRPDDSEDRPRRRGGILLGALAAAVLGALILAFTLDGGNHDADAGPTSAPTPAPTVTVTAPAAQPATTPAVKKAQTAPTPLQGAGVGGAGSTLQGASAGGALGGATHGSAHHTGRAVGHGKTH